MMGAKAAAENPPAVESREFQVAARLADMLNKWRRGEEDITAAEVWYVVQCVSRYMAVYGEKM